MANKSGEGFLITTNFYNSAKDTALLDTKKHNPEGNADVNPEGTASKKQEKTTTTKSRRRKVIPTGSTRSSTIP